MKVPPGNRAESSSCRTVGLWIEAATATLATAQGDDRIRLTRGLVEGLDAIDDVESVVVPCLPAAEPRLARLFADATRPDRLMSAKLRLVVAGRDPVFREAVAARVRRRRDRLIDRLAMIGATPAPRTWPESIGRLADRPTSRLPMPLRIAQRMIKLVRLGLMSWLAEAVLAALRCLPAPHMGVAAGLRRRRLAANWFLVVNDGASGRRLPGPKVLDLGGVSLPSGARGQGPVDAVMSRLAMAADAVVAPSQHAAEAWRPVCRGRAVAVIPPSLACAASASGDADESRRRLGDELRVAFLGDDVRPLHRHYCDFPFEQVEYLVAAAARGATPLLRAYALVLRRHRRNLKLVVDGLLPPGDGPIAEVHSLGLSFDVAEAAGLSEPARLRLLRHARGVIVADLDGGGVPPVFAEAVAIGTPVVLGRTPAVRETIPAEDLATPEYFDVTDDPEPAIRRAILSILDQPDEVRARQRALLARLSERTWRDVAAEKLALLGR